MKIYHYKGELYCDECAFIIDCSDLLNERETMPTVIAELKPSGWPEHCSSGANCTRAIDLGYEKIGCLLPVELDKYGYELVVTSNESPLTKIWREHYLNGNTGAKTV